MTDSSPRNQAGRLFASDLRAIREQQGVAIKDILDATRLAEDVIEQFEETALLDNPVFNRVYLRSLVSSYARLVDIDEKVALQGLEDTLRGEYEGALGTIYLSEVSPAEAADDAPDDAEPDDADPDDAPDDADPDDAPDDADPDEDDGAEDRNTTESKEGITDTDAADTRDVPDASDVPEDADASNDAEDASTSDAGAADAATSDPSTGESATPHARGDASELAESGAGSRTEEDPPRATNEVARARTRSDDPGDSVDSGAGQPGRAVVGDAADEPETPDTFGEKKKRAPASGGKARSRPGSTGRRSAGTVDSGGSMLSPAESRKGLLLPDMRGLIAAIVAGVVLIALVWISVAWFLDEPETEVQEPAVPAVDSTFVEPEPAPRPVVLPDTFEVHVIAYDEPLDPIRSRVDNDLRRPYWVEHGDTLTFRATDTVTLEREVDHALVLIESYVPPERWLEPDGQYVISRVRTQAWLDSLVAAGIFPPESPDSLAIPNLLEDGSGTRGGSGSGASGSGAIDSENGGAPGPDAPGAPTTDAEGTGNGESGLPDMGADRSSVAGSAGFAAAHDSGYPEAVVSVTTSVAPRAAR